MPEPKKRPSNTLEKPQKAPEQLNFFEPAPEVIEAVATAEPLLPESAPEVPSRVISTPARRRAAAEADRKHLTPLEVDRLLQAAKDNPRTGIRDRCLILGV